MTLNRGRVFENITVALVMAVVISIGGVLSNWFTGGGVIRFLGGVTQAKLFSVLHNRAKQNPETWNDIVLAVPGLAIPKDAVIAFDTPRGCPDGWSIFKDAQGGTMIVAATEDSRMAKAAAKHSQTVDREPSSVSPDYLYRNRGKLDSPEMGLKYIPLYLCKKDLVVSPSQN